MATVRIQVRRGTASQWTSANPILAAGELGVESDTNLFKFGNGSTTWTDLAYANNSDVAIGEISQDAINTALTMGSGLTKTYNDGSNSITIAVDAAYFNELAQDAVNTALTAGTGITKTYDDVANTLTVAVDSTIATKTYADDAVAAHQNDTTSVHGITNTEDLVYLTGAQTLSGKTLSDVVLSGTPTAPTQAANDNSTKIATTAYVQTELADLIGAAPAALDTLNELAAAINDDESYASTVTTAITGINNSLATKLPTTDFTAHLTDTTDVHGISDTANLVYTSDSRLSDNRTPINGSVVAASMAVDSITTTSITDAAVTGPKIAANAISQSHLSDDSVGTNEIGGLAVTTGKIADLAVTSAKIATDAVGSSHIAAEAVGTSELADNSVTAAKIAASAVGTSELADDAVTSVKITDLHVTTAKINDSAVTEAKIDGLAVTEGKIADASVSTAKIADSAITSAKIADGAIVNADINASAAIAMTKIDGLGDALDAKLASATASSTYAPIASPTFTGTVSGVTKSHVGLSNVDNTSDADKPVSTAAQSALDLKANLAAPTFTGTVVLPSTTSIGDVSATEIGYVNGVTSSIQTQIDAKASLSGATFTGNVEMDGNLVVDGDFTVNGTNFSASATSITIEDNLVQLAHQNSANTVDLGLVVAYNDGAAKHSGIVRDVSADKWKLFKGVTTEPSTTVDFTQGSLDALQVAAFEATSISATSATIGDVSNTELQYLNGVTSAVQTQIDSKAPTANPTFTGTVTVAASGVAFTDGTQTKQGVPSLTTIASATTGAYNLSTGGLGLRDQLIPIGGTHVITVPTNTTTAFPIGTSISFYQSAGTGGSFAGADVSVTILSTPGSTLRALYSSATLTKVATNTWLLAGDLKA